MFIHHHSVHSSRPAHCAGLVRPAQANAAVHQRRTFEWTRFRPPCSPASAAVMDYSTQASAREKLLEHLFIGACSRRSGAKDGAMSTSCGSRSIGADSTSCSKATV